MKYDRHAKILEMIENNIVETQEDLADRLKAAGFDVTQATVSRDIKELRLIKVMAENGSYKYASINAQGSNISSKHRTIFAQSVVKLDYAGNIMVIKTLSGMAQAAAAAIDAMDWPEIVGCIAGDDTIMVVVKSEENARELIVKFKKMLQ